MPVHNTRCPVVVRCEELWPHQLVDYEKHRLRTHKKNKDHCNPSRRHLNTRLLGKANWLALAQARIELMRQENFAEKLSAQKRQSRIKGMRETIRKGPQDPWERSENGPIREIILTAHHQWFEGANTPEEAKMMAERQAAEAVARGKTGAPRATNPRRTQALNAREAAFEAVAVDCLKATFKDAVLQARSDRDELGYHIHAIVMMTRDWESDRQGKQTRIQPSKHPLFKDYEKLQEDAGKAFAAVGLTRGKRTKRAREEMKKRGKEQPPKAHHVHPREHQAQEEVRLAAERNRLDADRAALDRRPRKVEARETAADARHDEADAILAVAEGVASGEIDVSPETEGKPVRLPSKGGLLPRMQRAPKAAARALKTFRQAFGRMRGKAEADTERDWADRHAALDTVRETYLGLKKALLDAVPASVRKKLGEDVQADEKRLAAGLVKLRRLGSKGREQGE
ncbi:MAG: hypothetical protein KDK11_03070 [Maritimibacter sp.]|nr:hypothetical protein [Maritimibacter sp.]